MAISFESTDNMVKSKGNSVVATKVFINLPIKDLSRSVRFFSELGFVFDQQFTDKNATCMILNDDTSVMLLVNDFFQTFTNKQIADPNTTSETIIAISAESKKAVITLVQKALDAGAKPHNEPDDQVFMYGWGFEDLDGHLWEVIWMNPAAAETPPKG